MRGTSLRRIETGGNPFADAVRRNGVVVEEELEGTGKRHMTADEVCGRICRSSEPVGNYDADALVGKDVAETEVVLLVVAVSHALVRWGCLR